MVREACPQGGRPDLGGLPRDEDAVVLVPAPAAGARRFRCRSDYAGPRVGDHRDGAAANGHHAPARRPLGYRGRHHDHLCHAQRCAEPRGSAAVGAGPRRLPPRAGHAADVVPPDDRQRAVPGAILHVEPRQLRRLATPEQKAAAKKQRRYIVTKRPYYPSMAEITEAFKWLADRGFGQAPKTVQIEGSVTTGFKMVFRKWAPGTDPASLPMAEMPKQIVSSSKILDFPAPPGKSGPKDGAR